MGIVSCIDEERRTKYIFFFLIQYYYLNNNTIIIILPTSYYSAIRAYQVQVTKITKCKNLLSRRFKIIGDQNISQDMFVNIVY